MTWLPSADAVALKCPFRSRWLWAGIMVWTLAFAVIAVRVAVGGSRNDLFPTYQQAGVAWVHGQPLYHTHQGFIYTPLIAAFFALLAWVPPNLGAALWRLVNAIAFLSAALWWFRRHETNNANADRQGIFLLLLFPISLGNLNNGQVNPLMIALLISAVLLAEARRWTLSALCVTVAAYFKIYPLAVGLLLAVIYPKEFSWRLLLALAGAGLLSLAFQHPDYVIDQYQRWFESRRTDPRRYDIDMAPRDLWMLARAFHVPLTETLYAVIQASTAAALAFVCAWGRLHRWPEERLLHVALLLGCCWMLLLGPSTESATYVLLAPLLVYALFTAVRHPIGMRSLVWASYATLLLGLALNSFLHLKKNIYLKSVQPFGALLFLVYACAWIFSPRWWREGDA